MQVWPLHAIMQYCKKCIKLILTWAPSVYMVQHTTGKIPEQVQQTRVYGTTNHGLKIQMFVLFQKTRSLMLGKFTSIPIYSLMLNTILF